MFIVPEEHIESSQILKISCNHDKCCPVVSLEECNDTIYDQLFRFIIYKYEFNDKTVVLDIYCHALGDEFLDDLLLSHSVLVSPEMLAKNLNDKILPSTAVIEESKLNPENGEISQKKKKQRFKERKRRNKICDIYSHQKLFCKEDYFFLIDVTIIRC